MTQPSVIITEQDGSLGVLPPSFGALLVLTGVCSAGPIGVPATFGSVKDIITAFGSGPLVEAACYAVFQYGNPVVIIRATSATVSTVGATYGNVAVGTSDATTKAGSTSYDDYEVYVKVLNGGTIGVAGITLSYSLDGGRTMSLPTALGTDDEFLIPNSGGITFEFSAGTLVANDAFYAIAVAPMFDTAGIGVALTALKNSSVTWRTCEIVGATTASLATAINSAFVSMQSAHKPKFFIANTRPLTLGASPESEATYLSTLSAAFASIATTFGSICASSAYIISAVSGAFYQRAINVAIAPFANAVSPEQDIASINFGTIPGVQLLDDNGNPVVGNHDESLNPGLDDARFTVLRTWVGVQGVYVNRPRIFSAQGSDFELYPHRLVFNIGEDALYQYLIRRTNLPIRVSKTTGRILESEALEIEAGALNAMSAALLGTPYASDVQFVLSRTDVVLSTKTLNYESGIIPLGYVEFITGTLGFVNPALAVQAV